MALKQRKEIADYIGGGKTERAKIRVEHIIREDYLVEAMEVVEMYCDLILARYDKSNNSDQSNFEFVISVFSPTPNIVFI